MELIVAGAKATALESPEIRKGQALYGCSYWTKARPILTKTAQNIHLELDYVTGATIRV